MKPLKLAFGVLLILTVSSSCRKETIEPSVPTTSTQEYFDLSANQKGVKTFYGQPYRLGGGIVRTYYQEDINGIPMGVGIKLTAKALENLPHETLEFVLDLPVQASDLNYTHVTVGWNPHGHEPEGIYDRPHFDLHFYTVSNEYRLNIGSDPALYDNVPAEKYQPPMYFKIPGGVPQMGAHWINVLSPEFNGGEFGHTFIYGSYDGAFIFYEPMFTLDYLLSLPNETVAIRQPEAFQKAGYYPLGYRTAYSQNLDEYCIGLTGLIYRTAE